MKLYDKYLKTATAYNASQNYLTDYSAMDTESVLVRTDVIFPLKDIRFEDTVFPAPDNLDSYLTTVYHDYMKLPKPEERHNHLAEVLDFGE